MLANHHSGPFISLSITYDDYIVANKDYKLLIALHEATVL